MPQPHWLIVLVISIELLPQITGKIEENSLLLDGQEEQRNSPHVNQLVLNPEKLDLLLHNAAVFSLLKAKARALLAEPSFPRADAFLYSRCAVDATTAVQLAKCVVPLLEARDAMKRSVEEQQSQLASKVEARGPAEMDWPSRLGQWILQGLAKFGFGMNKTEKLKEQKKAEANNHMEIGLERKRRRRIRLPSANEIDTKQSGNLEKNEEKMFDKESEMDNQFSNDGIMKKEKRLREGRQSLRDRATRRHRGKATKLTYNEQNEQTIDRQLQIQPIQSRRYKRAAVKVDPVLLFQRMFQPNARQAKRAEMARAKRQGKDVASLRKPMDFLSGKNVPWHMKPLSQLLRLAKGLLSGKGLEKLKEKMKKMRKIRRREEEQKTRLIEDNMERRRLKRNEYEEEDGLKEKKMMTNGKEEKRRRVEETEPEAEGKSKPMSNIAKLQRIQHFYAMFERCQRHMADMGETNARFLDQFSPPGANQLPLQSRIARSQFDELADELQRVLSNYSFHSFPILSPRLLSLFPESAAKNAAEPSLLSPTIFSFQREGLFSLPTLFGLVSTSERDMLELLDLFMELAGATKVLDKLLANIEPRMEAMERELYPTVLRLERMERRWNAVRASFSEDQRTALDRWGYAILDGKQFGRLYGGKGKHWGLTDEFQLEEDIRRMARMDEKVAASQRSRREATPPAADNSSSMAVVGDEQLRSLRPFLFTNKLRQQAAVAVNGVVLSPRAFVTTLTRPNFMWMNILSPVAFAPNILSPRAMALTVLSPTAFTANILTPNTLWTEVLSPKFFHSNILSPRALAALILSPRTMLGEVLSPKMIEFRVLNPGTFFAGVLTPNLLMPRVLSPNNFGVTVLSPNILSPSILSKGNFTVQVLSPSIMSDDVSTEQFWRGEWQKPKANTTAL